MPNENHGDDPQAIWQNQGAREMKISTAYFKVKTEQLRSKSRLIALANDLGCVAIVTVLAIEFTKFSAISRVGAVLLAAGYAYAVWRSHQRLWLAPHGGQAPVAGVQAYLGELQKSRSEARTIWPILGPILPGCIVFAAPYVAAIGRRALANPAILINAAPFCVLMVVWLVLVFPVRKRRLRNIDREIEALSGLGGCDNGA